MEASLWARCMCALEAELPEQQFNTWVRPLQALEGAGALKLLAPNRFVVEWINEKLLPRIGELLRDKSTGDVPIVTVEVGSRGEPLPPSTESSGEARRPRRGDGLVVGARLNGEFTFTTFVEGKSNQMAKAAAVQVAENPGRAYNPLFLYGGVGLGKTHLMHAIAHVVREQNEEIEPGKTTMDGVFVVGSATAVRDIPDTIVHSEAASAQIASYLRRKGVKV